MQWWVEFEFVDLDLFATQFSDKWKLIEYEVNKFWEGFGWFLQMYLIALYQKPKWKKNPSQLKLELKLSLRQMIAIVILHPLIEEHITVYLYV